MTKQEFAAHKKRKPSAISNWIADGKISAAALVGEGVRARIWVEQAERDLEIGLDPGQQSAQALPAASVEDEDLRRRRRADADRAEHDAEAARRRLAVDEGRYVLAHEAAREWTRALSKLISEIETFLSTTLARGLADKHGLDWKELTVDMREKFRLFRGGLSEEARARRAAIENGEDDQSHAGNCQSDGQLPASEHADCPPVGTLKGGA